MGNLGRTVQPARSGYDFSIIAGADVEWLMGGVTFDWSLVTAVAVDTTYPDGRVVRAGQKALRYGQFVTRITGGGAAVATLNNTPTGGTFTLSVTAAGTTSTTTAIAYNAIGSTVQAAILALPNVATTVTGTPGTSYLIVLPPWLQDGVISIGTASLTGGSATLAGNTISVTATGGTLTVTVTVIGNAQTTSALAFNASLATVTAAINGLSSVGASATVTGSASGPYTFAFPAPMGGVTVTGNGASLTGSGSQPTVTVATSSDGLSRWFGPFDPSASDGRQTLHRGDIGLVNRTIVQGGSLGLNEVDDTHFGVIVGGHVYIGLVIQSGTAGHSLTAGPTQAELEAAMPTLVLQLRT